MQMEVSTCLCSWGKFNAVWHSHLFHTSLAILKHTILESRSSLPYLTFSHLTSPFSFSFSLCVCQCTGDGVCFADCLFFVAAPTNLSFLFDQQEDV
jgi:hypothetical protein